MRNVRQPNMTTVRRFSNPNHRDVTTRQIVLEKLVMQTMLLVINARQPQLSTVEFACRLAALTHSKLTGLFVENLYTREDRPSVTEGSYFKAVAEKGVDTTVATDADQAVTLFLRECAIHQVPTTVLVNKGEPIQEVLRESRYADLLIVEPGINFYGDEEQLPSHFTKEMLANAECPVLLAPEKAATAEEVVFCYDGSASSVFAIKQFTYLLPEYKNKKVVLLEVKNDAEENNNESHQRMMDWLQAHYSQVNYKILTGNASDELFTYFFMKENRMVVMGSYGRSALSNLFRRSAADPLIRAVDLPLFITHYNR